jgi:triacylglycerol lipase
MSILTTWSKELYKPNAFEKFAVTRQLDMGTALALMWVSQLAYETDSVNSSASQEKIKSILDTWGLQLLDIVATRITDALPLVSRTVLLIGGRGAVIIVFAGTDPVRLQDWITNFSFVPDPAGLNGGLGNFVAAVLPSIQAFVARQNSPKIFVAGHSLGGALAVGLASALNKDNISEVEAVYTYGMPRAGGPVFAADYDQRLGARTFRFVHGDDLVPTVPPEALPHLEFRYQHVGWYLHCARLGHFDSRQVSADTHSNEPAFIPGVERSFAEPPSWWTRSQLGLRLIFGGAPQDARRDPIGIAIELLPPRIRDHLQDRYIAALTA